MNQTKSFIEVLIECINENLIEVVLSSQAHHRLDVLDDFGGQSASFFQAAFSFRLVGPSLNIDETSNEVDRNKAHDNQAQLPVYYEANYDRKSHSG